MNALFKLAVLAVMAALFAATQPKTDGAGRFQSARLETHQALAHLR